MQLFVIHPDPALKQAIRGFQYPITIHWIEPGADIVDRLNRGFQPGQPIVILDGQVKIQDPAWLDLLVTPLMSAMGALGFSGPVLNFWPDVWSRAVNPFCIAIHPKYWKALPLDKSWFLGLVLLQSGKPMASINIPIMIDVLPGLSPEDVSQAGTVIIDVDGTLTPRPEKPGSAKTVTAVISSKNRRLTTLPQAVAAIITQTKKPDKLVIYDDSDAFPTKEQFEEAPWKELLKWSQHVGIPWYYLPGSRNGQVLNHRASIEGCTTDLIWRVDDDNIPEPDVLEKLWMTIQDDTVGAVASLVHIPGNFHSKRSGIHSGKADDVMNMLNVQWSDRSTDLILVEHLHNTFLFRKEAAQPIVDCLSPVGHREETIFSYQMSRAGWKLVVNSTVVTWHLRSGSGGIRAYNNHALWHQDERVFQRLCKAWGFKLSEWKVIVLDCGLGDHYAFKAAFPDIRKANPGKKFILGVCCSEIFLDEPDVEIVSVSEAALVAASPEAHNVYQWMISNQWEGSLIDAFKRLYS